MLLCALRTPQRKIFSSSMYIHVQRRVPTRVVKRLVSKISAYVSPTKGIASVVNRVTWRLWIGRVCRARDGAGCPAPLCGFFIVNGSEPLPSPRTESSAEPSLGQTVMPQDGLWFAPQSVVPSGVGRATFISCCWLALWEPHLLRCEEGAP